MKLIKITTEDSNLIKPYMTEIMSFDEGVIEIIVGYDLAKKMGATILNHKIKKNVYWTFSPREKRKIFEEHIKSFVQESIQSIISEIKIKNINPLDFKDQTDYLNHLKKNINGCSGYLYSDRLYIYCDNLIQHIDIGLLKFLSWDIINEVKSLLKVKEYERIPKELENLNVKYIPYFNAKKSNIISNLHHP